MARRHPILRGLAITAALGAGLAVAFGALRAGGLARLGFGKRVAVLELHGVIQDATDAVESLEGFRRDESTVAAVVRIDSPGGAVAPSQEIYDAVWRLREEKPVVASLGNVAASGGYYVASAASVVFADPGTITGSIGAIMEVPYYGPLAERLGVRAEVVKSGHFKDSGNPLRPMTAEERRLFQGMVDDVLTQFVDAVARGRTMDPAAVRKLADGRVYSGVQARAAGLVDELGGLVDATRRAWEEAGESGEPRVSRVRLRRRPWWLDMVSRALVAEPRGLSGGLLFLYQGPVAE
jgi:protease-4